jgi:RNA polymerase sigma-70 factor (ECF subfamily)
VHDLTRELELTGAEADAIDVAFAATGDTQAFERLYRRHVPRVNSLARWLLSREDVDDVLQDVFVRAWERLGTFRGDAAFGTWLHRLATNVILRQRERDQTSERRYAGSGLELDQAHAARVSPELRVDMEAAVDRLPARARHVFVLHDLEGFKHEEIAATLGISAGTSRSQLHHARMALRSFLAPSGGGA